MAKKNLGTLVLDLSANTAQFTAGMTKAERETDSLKKKFNEIKVGVGALATAMSVAGTAIVVEAVNSAKSIAGISGATNVAQKDLQRLAVGAKIAGVDLKTLGGIVQNANDRFVKMAGGKSFLLPYLKQIENQTGLTADKFKELSGIEGIQSFYNALEKASLPAEQMAFLMDGLAKGSRDLIPLFQNNGQMLKELGDWGERTGQVLSDGLIENSLQLDAVWEILTGTAKGMRNQMAEQLMPVIAFVSDRFVDFAENSATLDGAFWAINKTIKVVVTGVATLSAGIETLANIFSFFTTSKNKFLDYGHLAYYQEGSKSWLIAKEAIDAHNKALAESADIKVAKSWEQIAEENKQIFYSLAQDVQGLWNDNIEQTENAKNKTLESILSIKRGVLEAGAPDSVSSIQDEQEQITQIYDDNLQRRAQAIREQYLDEGLRIEMRYAREQATLLEARENQIAHIEAEIADAQLRAETILMIEEQYAEDSKRIEEQRAQAIGEISKRELQAKIQGTKQALSSISTLMNSENRKLFEIGKAGAIANAIVNTSEGVTKAWALGPILGPILAPLVATAGAAQIATIASTKFGSSAGASATTALNNASAPVEPAVQSRNVYLSGINEDTLVRAGTLVEMVNEELENGGRLIIQ